MKNLLLLSFLLFAAGCATTPMLTPTPLTQDALDAFLQSGRDARYYGITIYHDAAGDRFEFANRIHQDRNARMDFASPRSMDVPLIVARTSRFVDFNLLLDSSARQNWLLFQSVKAMDYRPFAPPTGEYPDHVAMDIPGYAGVANKIVMNTLHVESPVFFVPPAIGGLGPLARAEENPYASPSAAKKRRQLGAKTHAVMGAALMKAFSFIRFDFDARQVFFGSHTTYRPAVPSAVLAQLPMMNWRGRPMVEGTLDGQPIRLVVDTAGDFDLSLPGEPDATEGTLVLGNWTVEDAAIQSHAEGGLPEDFPARIGLGLLARHYLTLDHKQHIVWIEETADPETEPVTRDGSGAEDMPVTYRGIR